MIVDIKNKVYFTNISDHEMLEKCKIFNDKCCQSYAISFENPPEYTICITKERGFGVKLLRNLNKELIFVPEKHKEKTAEQLIKAGLTLIEII